jgi:glycosyltransferase involved in cell wall biosynthesis
MRVLMVANGRVIHARRPLEWLVSRDVEVLFLDTTATLPVQAITGCIRRQFPRPFRSYRVNQLAQWTGDWTRAVADTLFDSAVWLQLRWSYARFGANVAHVHWIDTEAYHIAKAGIRPLILSAWGTDINRLFLDSSDLAPAALRAQVSYALRKCDCLITDAPELVRRAEELAGRSLEHALLPLGIDTKRFARNLTAERRHWRERLAIPDDAFLFGSFREMRPHYGHHLILEAFARAQTISDRQLFLLFKPYYSEGIAREAGYEQSIRARALELGVDERLRWTHDVPHDALPELYAAVDGLINYPAMDGFPVHFLEVAAARRPMISCRHPAYDWGFARASFDFVERGDEHALADAMHRTAAGSTEWSRRLVAAFQAVTTQYDEAIVSETLLEIYRRFAR